MGDISKNISRFEISCGCKCNSDTIDHETVMVVQGICDHFAAELERERVVLKIHSAHRCDTHNAEVGGAQNSQHLKGRALDISIRYVEPVEIHDWLILHYPGKYGIGLYHNFVHIDTRSGIPARWRG